MLPGFIALPCPRCARSVPLLSYSIISTAVSVCLFTLCALVMYNSPFLVSAAGLWLCLAVPCLTPGWSHCRGSGEDGAGFGRKGAETLREFVATRPFPPCRSHRVSNIGTVHSKESISAYLLLRKQENAETFEITLLDLFEVKIFFLRVNMNFHLDV